jgi:hypothetical protein
MTQSGKNSMTSSLKTLMAVAILSASASAGAQTAPEIPFDASIDVIKTGIDLYLGEVGGVGQNSKGSIFVYTRTGHPYATLGDNRTFLRNGSKLYEFDKTGKFVRELGQMSYGFNMAFGLRVDPQDNVWTVDLAANQVVKFAPDGSIALVLGRKPEAIGVRPPPPPAPGESPRPGGGGGGGGGQVQGPPGTGVPGSGLNRPTDVAWDKAGNIYISDGIGNNNRVVKLAPDGRFIKHWGNTGSGDGQFNGAKSIALDAAGNVYVADVGNKRIQVFDGEGNYKSQFAGIGTPQTMCMTSGPTQYLYIAHSGDPDGMDDAAIYKVKLDGTVVGKFGSAGKLVKEFSLVNSIDCRNENELLVGEMANWRVQKVTLKAR